MTEEVTKKLTVREFQHWLSGVEEMQESDWTPSATQWKRIRSKINDIDDTPVVVPTSKTNRAPREETTTYVERPVQYAPSSIMPNPAQDLAGKPFMPDNPAIAVKTPNIDTTNGTYGSPFI